MKKILAGLLALVVIGGAVPYNNYFVQENISITANAEEIEEYTEGTYESLTYRKYSDHIEISGCDKSVTEIIIPNEIEGVPVTSIGDNAFSNCKSLTLITIPDSVTSIAAWAFLGCESLISITIPDSVKSIGYQSFVHCSSLTEITIENPECEIYDYSSTISNGYDENDNVYFNGTIYGYENSTAQAYAEKYERNFVSLGDAPTTETLEPTLKGDANEDGEVGISDVVAVAAFVANSDKNPLSEQGQANADVHNTGNGLNASDAFAIQQFATGIIESWNESCEPKLYLKVNGESLYKAKPGEKVTLTYEVYGANNNWTSSGIHFNFDNRLSAEYYFDTSINMESIKCTRGDAVENLEGFYVALTNNEAFPDDILENESGIFVITFGTQTGQSGIIASFDFIIPETAETGDTYKFRFWRHENDEFTNLAVDKEMQEYAFANWQGAEIIIE